MIWNHRVIKEVEHDEEWYYLKEVYYYEDGKPSHCSDRPPILNGESVEELRTILEQMLGALDKPIINK